MPTLSDIPQLKALYEETEKEAASVEAFVNKCEVELSEALESDAMPSKSLVEAIAVAKVTAVETSIDHCFRLKQEVGSYALMGGSGFEQMDFLQCCKFAEGDSRILMQKMARDAFRAYQKDRALPEGVTAACETLGRGLSQRSSEGASAAESWDACWESVYDLAKACIAEELSKRA